MLFTFSERYLMDFKVYMGIVCFLIKKRQFIGFLKTSNTK